MKALKSSKDINSEEYKIVNPQLNAMARLHHSIEGGLDDVSKSSEEKAKMYVQAFNDFLTFKNQYTNNSSSHIIPNSTEEIVGKKNLKTLSSPDIASTVPKNLRSKAERLADLLKESGTIAWDEQNRLIVDGKPVEGTNIIDLINDALRRWKTFMPHGRRVFAEQLKGINAPRELVGNPHYWAESEEASSQDGEYDSDTLKRTPAKQKKTLKVKSSPSHVSSFKPRRKTEWRKNRPNIEDIDWTTDINM